MTRLLTPAIAAALVLASAAATDRLRASSGQAAPASRTIWAGVFTESQATRGRDAYLRHCAWCHMMNLEGDGNLTALAGERFLARWKNRPVDGLFQTLSSLMPMEAAGSLPRATYVDITAYLLQYNHYPAGRTELTSEAGALERIVFEANPPR